MKAGYARMKKIAIGLICMLLVCGTAPGKGTAGTEGHGAAASVEYAVFGGMENESFSMELTPGNGARESILTVRDNNREEKHTVSITAMRDLSGYIERLQPETWEDYPDSEFFAYDAPTVLVTVRYEDDECFSLSNSQEGAREILGNIRCFLESCLAENREPFVLTFRSFEGGGPSFRAVISEPEKLECVIRTEYDEPGDPIPPGSAYSVIMEFRGRIPGTVEVYVETDGPLVPAEDIPPAVYVLEIDRDFNVRPAE